MRPLAASPVAACVSRGTVEVWSCDAASGCQSCSSLCMTWYCGGLELREETFGGAVHYGVFCGRDTVIPRSTRYGPFAGKIVNTSEIKTNDDNSFMWEVRAPSCPAAEPNMYRPTQRDSDVVLLHVHNYFTFRLHWT